MIRQTEPPDAADAVSKVLNAESRHGPLIRGTEPSPFIPHARGCKTRVRPVRQARSNPRVLSVLQVLTVVFDRLQGVAGEIRGSLFGGVYFSVLPPKPAFPAKLSVLARLMSRMGWLLRPSAAYGICFICETPESPVRWRWSKAAVPGWVSTKYS